MPKPVAVSDNELAYLKALDDAKAFFQNLPEGVLPADSETHEKTAQHITALEAAADILEKKLRKAIEGYPEGRFDSMKELAASMVKHLKKTPCSTL